LKSDRKGKSMKYSIALYFDNETESKIQNIINSLVINGVNDYLILNNIPPHITLSDFDCDDLNEVVEKLHIEIKRMEKSYVYWASIGYLNGDEVYIAEVLFVCHEFEGELKVEEYEVLEQKFFNLHELPSNISPINKENIYNYIKCTM